MTTEFFKGLNTTSAECQTFLNYGYSLAAKLYGGYRLLEKYLSTEEVKDVPAGLTAQDIKDAELQDGVDIVYGMNVSELQEMLLLGKFGVNIPALRMKRALSYCSVVEYDFGEIAKFIPDTETLLALKNNTEFALGNWIHGFAATIDLQSVAKLVLSKDPPADVRLNHEIGLWLSGFSSVEVRRSVIKGLLTFCRKFIPITEAFLESPSEWNDFVATVPADYKDDILMYADSVYTCDIIAYRMGKIQIDDNYINIIKRRCESDNSLENEGPDVVAKFIQKLPPEYSDILVTYADTITVEDMLDIINDKKKLDLQFIVYLENKKRKSSLTTNAFGNFKGMN